MATFVTDSSGQMEGKSGASCEISLDKSVLQESKEMQQCPQASKRERESLIIELPFCYTCTTYPSRTLIITLN